MGILGVVVVLDEVELDVVLGTHVTPTMRQYLPCVGARLRGIDAW